MTMYEPNPDVDPTGAEASEFVDTPQNEPGEQSDPDAPTGRPSDDNEPGERRERRDEPRADSE